MLIYFNVIRYGIKHRQHVLPKALNSRFLVTSKIDRFRRIANGLCTAICMCILTKLHHFKAHNLKKNPRRGISPSQTQYPLKGIFNPQNHPFSDYSASSLTLSYQSINLIICPGMQDTRLDTKGGCNPHLGLQVPVKQHNKNNRWQIPKT